MNLSKEDSYQPVHLRSLIGVFAVCSVVSQRWKLNRMCEPIWVFCIYFWTEHSMRTAIGRMLTWRSISAYRTTELWRIHYVNTPMQYDVIAAGEKVKFSNVKFWYFSYFSSKHSLWLLVRTTWFRVFSIHPQTHPKSMFQSRNQKKIMLPL